MTNFDRSLGSLTYKDIQDLQIIQHGLCPRSFAGCDECPVGATFAEPHSGVVWQDCATCAKERLGELEAIDKILLGENDGA